MKLEELLLEKKTAIQKRWLALILETYPEETARFLKKQKNRFANPVGYTITQGVEGLLDQLLQGDDIDTEKVSPFLDNIIRVRAIQDFTPAQALAFILILKNLVRDELRNELQEGWVSEELLEFESRVDALLLLSFEIYMKCREKLYEIKVNDMRRSVHMLLRRANLISGTPGQESDLEENDTDNPL